MYFLIQLCIIKYVFSHPINLISSQYNYVVVVCVVIM